MSVGSDGAHYNFYLIKDDDYISVSVACPHPTSKTVKRCYIHNVAKVIKLLDNDSDD